MNPYNSPVQTITKQLLERLDQSLGRGAIASLSAVWNESWKPRLCEIRAEASRSPTVTIAVIGGTGAGKSTLLNALLGERVLPVSSSSACTAAISEVESGGSEFTADIDFISRTDWQKEISLLLADVADETKTDPQPAVGAETVAKAARHRLRAVYQISEEQVRPGLKLDELKEPEEIRKCLDAGRITVAAKSADEFRKLLRRYLDSKCEFWPLVRTARIRGPFPGLTTSGIKLVDLPGLNDANEAREQVTRNYLKECRFVWIVFSMKRALTRDIQTIMQSDDFARQLVLDGRDNALSFVGTHSDDLDRDSVIEEFRLPEDASESDVVAARSSAVRKEVYDQLSELARRLALDAGDQNRTEALSNRLRQSQVFTVSAKDYLHLTKGSRSKSTTFGDKDETQIPALRDHLATISAAFTAGAHQDSLIKRVELLVEEINHRIKAEITYVANARELTVKKRKEIRGALQQLLTFLKRDLDSHCEGFKQEMTAKRQLLDERLKRAFERARAELQRVTDSWSHIHWATLRAIVRRNGRYNSPTSGYFDFADDVSRPALGMITFAWDDFFGDKMRHALTVWSDKLIVLAERHGNDTVEEVIRQAGGQSGSLSDDLNKSLAVNERLIKEYVGQCEADMSGKLNDVRSSLHEQIPREVTANMRGVYAQLESESGTGMKQRILELLSTHVRQVSELMFDNSCTIIMEGVRGLTDAMSQRHKLMTDGVAGRLEIPIANFAKEDGGCDVDGVGTSSLPSILRQIEEIVKDSQGAG
jgi:GTPase SAR1 family protein